MLRCKALKYPHCVYKMKILHESLHLHLPLASHHIKPNQPIRAGLCLRGLIG